MRMPGAFAALALLCLPLTASAGGGFDLGKAAGVYKDRFPNGTIDGQSYTSEDVFELVPVGKRAAYFRLHLEFYNGHECALWGIADVEGDALVFHRAPDYDGAQPCELRFTDNGKAIVLQDETGGCQMMSCGSRGGYNGETFPFAKRRPIRYMPRLLASREYKEAVAEHRQGPGAAHR